MSDGTSGDNVIDLSEARAAAPLQQPAPDVQKADVLERIAAAVAEQRQVVVVLEERDGNRSRYTLDQAGVEVRDLAFIGAFLTKVALGGANET